METLRTHASLLPSQRDLVGSEVKGSALKRAGPLLHGEIRWIVPTVLRRTAYGQFGVAWGIPSVDC